MGSSSPLPGQCRWQFFFRPPGLRLVSQRNHLQHQYSKLFCYANINVLFIHLSPIGVLTKKINDQILQHDLDQRNENY